jgi:hypothetical protein
MNWAEEELSGISLGDALNGNWVDHRECRIRRNFLLIYPVKGTLTSATKEIRGNLYGRHSCLRLLCRSWVSNSEGAGRAAVPSEWVRGQ